MRSRGPTSCGAAVACAAAALLSEAACPRAALAQRRIDVYLLPVAAPALPDSARHLVADVPARLRRVLTSADPRIHVTSVPRDSLSRAGIRVDSLNADRLHTIRPWWERAARRDSAGVEAYALLLELAPVRVGLPGAERTVVHARYSLATDSLVTALEDTVTITPDEEERLVNGIADRLVVRLTKNIRIAISDFRLSGADAAGGPMYGRAVARMLGTRLSASPRLLLLEYSESDSALRAVRERSATPGSADALTLVERGRELLANYLVTGDVWQVANALRLDVRCVSVESRATIVSRGVTIEPISIRSIDAQLADLAADMLSAIESDFTQRSQRPRYVAVAGVYPVPNTGENRAVTASIVRSLQRKISYAGHDRLRVREQYDGAAALWSGRDARWNIAAQLDADVLVQLRLDRVERDAPVLDVTLFDADRPMVTRSVSLGGSIDALDSVMDEIVDSLFAEQRVELGAAERKRMRRERYRGPERSYWTDLAYGLAGRTNARAFLGAAGGVVVRAAPNLLRGADRQMLLEPIGLRIDGWGMKNAAVGTGSNYVVGFDLFASLSYRFRRHRATSPFIGGQLNLLSGVVRHAHTETQFDGQPGAGVVLGLVNTLTSGRKLRYRLELQTTFVPLGEKVLDLERFAGGRIAKAYFTVGTSR